MDASQTTPAHASTVPVPPAPVIAIPHCVAPDELYLIKNPSNAVELAIEMALVVSEPVPLLFNNVYVVELSESLPHTYMFPLLSVVTPNGRAVEFASLYAIVRLPDELYFSRNGVPLTEVDVVLYAVPDELISDRLPVISHSPTTYTSVPTHVTAIINDVTDALNGLIEN